MLNCPGRKEKPSPSSSGKSASVNVSSVSWLTRTMRYGTGSMASGNGAPGAAVADGDGHFSHAKDVEHVELPGQERKALSVLQRQKRKREGVVGFLAHPHNAVRHRQHGIRETDDT